MTAGAPKSLFEEARRALDRADSAALVCHVSPDGDALGSMLAMRRYLEDGRRSVAATFPAPFVVPPQFRLLPGVEKLQPPESVLEESYEVVITFDCGSTDRTGELQSLLEQAREVVVIDHHVSNPGYGTVNLVFPEASSSSEIVYDFLCYVGAPVDSDMATCLYVGIATDTGRFQYSNTSARVFEIAAELVSKGVDVARVSRRVFEEAPLATLRMLGAMLERAAFDESTRTVYSWIDRHDLERFGVHLAETDDYIDVLRRTEEAEITLLVKEVEPGVSKVSLRSLGGIDVAEVARSFGGGGHAMAAGFTVGEPPAETLALVLDQLRRCRRSGSY